MTKKKKLVKIALRHPDLYSDAELAYFQRWLALRKERKEKKKALKRLELEKTFLES